MFNSANFLLRLAKRFVQNLTFENRTQLTADQRGGQEQDMGSIPPSVGSILSTGTKRIMLRRLFQLGALSLLVTLSLTVYLYAISKLSASSPQPWYTLPAPCKLPDSVLDDLEALAFHMHHVLDVLKVPHVLCYGTLWGALRQGRILSWDTNIDFCAMDVHLAGVSSGQLKAAFLKKGIHFHYDWWTGVYHARSYRGAEGHVYVFTKSALDTAVPGGCAKVVWRWLGQKQLSFPAWLLEAPFRTERFQGENFPVPHEGIELLKYLYPNDWWLEVKPPGCG